ncbi:MAG: exodeoxyribonuclease V subunit alpha [Nocardioidaceae bacterium]|nr:exodeoxyribonuclease V subunit alpha [Nocardioidaceae bacterium]MCL2612477.1 exodeoxyribonuclease V subunit alpha [Nocardioidaceae bacterium]
MTTTDASPWIARGATGLLAAFNEAGVLHAADVRVAQRVGVLGGETDERVLLAVASAVRAVRLGSVGADLAALPASIGATETELPWPDPDDWVAAVVASPLTAAQVIHHDQGLVYLDRYHRLECEVAEILRDRVAAPPPVVVEDVLAASLERVGGPHLSEEQAAAVEQSVRRRTLVLTGGPGTGKTTTVARMVYALAQQHAAGADGHLRPFSVALAAPTGKAATRLQEAVAAELAGLGITADELSPPHARTIHRLLGWRPDNTTRFVHDRGNRLGHDLVVVDEASMVDLTLMARLLEAVRPDSRLILVGDPQQLTSVGAGAVLSDLVAGFEGRADSPVCALRTNHRSTEDIKALAAALRAGDADAVLAVLRSGSAEVEYDETDDPESVLRERCVAAARAVREAATSDAPAADRAAAADEALQEFRLLCAHREGPAGVRLWNQHIEQWLAEETGQPLGGRWYPGRPLLVTANDYALDIYNGETGVVVVDEGRPRVWISGARQRTLAPSRLDAVETMHAMTIHKSQGSQAAEIAVLLPDADSRLLSRELFYTAVTRAQRKVRVVGTEAAVRAAVATTAQRATGLRGRLSEPNQDPPYPVSGR